MSFSKYPAQLDDSSSIPPAIDNVTPVAAECFNRLRDAILAIQAELGTDPSRAYGTVRARLDALRAEINTIKAILAAGGGGTGSGGAPSVDDKNQTSSATSGNEQPTGVTITNTPFTDSYVRVDINGLSAIVGDGVKTDECYFSNNGGTSARAIANITAGDQLIWNGTVAGFDLDASDRVDFHYDVA